MNNGYIKLYRSISDNILWGLEPFTKAQAWIDVLLMANHKNSHYQVRGNIVHVKRGFIARSEDHLAKKWKWSRNKVRRYLKYLETIQQIKQHKSNVITVIEIINYNKYQANGTTEGTTERPQKVQQKDIYNNDKNEKNEKKNTYHEEFINVWDDYPSKRREKKKDCYKVWKCIPEQDREKFYKATKDYVYSNIEGDYKYCKMSLRWFKDWETVLDSHVPPPKKEPRRWM